MTKTEFFDRYTQAGFKIIPLVGKIPILGGWENADAHDAGRCREMIQATPNSNMGLLLGEYVDVEGDSEQANATLDRLVGDTPHPKWRSSRSVHHLFLNPDPELTRFVTKKIEFRGHKHQSVLPPSQHEDGCLYSWMKGTKFPVPRMPDALVDFYWSRRTSVRKPLLKPGHVSMTCHLCGYKTMLHHKKLIKERLWCSIAGVRWSCRKCR